MASSYTTRLRLEKPGSGEQAGTWGVTANTDYDLLDASIAGVVTVAHDNTANYTLTSLSGTADEARNLVLLITGTLTAARNVIIPSTQKVYLVRNATTGGYAVTVKTSGGIGLSVAAGYNQWVYTEGTNVYAATPAYNPTTGSFTGNVTTADKWTTARTLSLSGDASGSVSFDGSANATLALTIPGLAQAGVQSISLAGTTARAGTVSITEGDTVNILLGGNVVRLFNGRPGNVNLTSGDVTTALGFSPLASFMGRVTPAAVVTAADITSALGATAVQNATYATTAGSTTTANYATSAGSATNFSGTISGTQVSSAVANATAAVTATKWASSRLISLSGDVTGSVSLDGSANVSMVTTGVKAVAADKWTTARTITMGGVLTGSTSFDGSANFTVTAGFASSPTFSGTVTAGAFTTTGTVTAPNLSTTASSGVYSSGTGRSVQFDTGDLIFYDTSGNTMDFTIGAAAKLTLSASAATFSVAASGPSFTSTSDRSLKDDIQPVTGGLSRIMNYQPVSWLWKTTTPYQHVNRQSGFVAQDVAPINPLAVVEPVSPDGYPAIDPMAIIADLVDAVKTLSARVAALEAS